MEIKLTIILPIYNVEKFLPNCLNSLLDQDLPKENYEIICVDDCSPDNSIEIVKEYQNLVPNVRLICHSTNKKTGGARNTGVYNAKGKYIWFVDSDDWIIPNTLGKLVDICEKQDLDVLAFNLSRYDDKGQMISFNQIYSDSNVMNGIELIESQFGDSFVYYILGLPVMYVCKKDIIQRNGIQFPEERIGEDSSYPCEILMNSERTKSISDIIYCYRSNAESVTSSLGKKPSFDLLFHYLFYSSKYIDELSNKMKHKSHHLSELLIQDSIAQCNRFASLYLQLSVGERRKINNLSTEECEMIKTKYEKLSFLNKIMLSRFGFLYSLILTPIYRAFRECK